MTRAIYVLGLPGVGKTTLCHAASARLKIRLLKYSDLIEYSGKRSEDFEEVVEASRSLFRPELTLFDSFPKGAKQAEYLWHFAPPVLVVQVLCVPEEALLRAQRRSPDRFSDDVAWSKLERRMVQTREAVEYCRRRQVEIINLYNFHDEGGYIECGVLALRKEVNKGEFRCPAQT